MHGMTHCSGVQALQAADAGSQRMHCTPASGHLIGSVPTTCAAGLQVIPGAITPTTSTTNRARHLTVAQGTRVGDRAGGRGDCQRDGFVGLEGGWRG